MNEQELKSNAGHEKGLNVARRVARWELGSGNWADRIIHAYLNPERASKELQESMELKA